MIYNCYSINLVSAQLNGCKNEFINFYLFNVIFNFV